MQIIKMSIKYLCDEGLLKLVQELKVEQVLGRECLLTDDGLHGLDVLADGVAGVQLVGHISVVLAGHALADGRLHETTKGGKDVDGWVDLSIAQLTINVHLTFGDVASQIGNRMRDVVVWHSENGNLSDRTGTAFNSTGTLVDGRQIGVHVTWETSTAGHLLSGGRHLKFKKNVSNHVWQQQTETYLSQGLSV